MDARRTRAASLAVVLLIGAVCHGASLRSTNFVVTTPNPHFAKQAIHLAEQYRRQLAIDWLGRELPPWPQPCPITLHVGAHLSPGGATKFCFHNGQPFDWSMAIQGPADRLLDSVLPHEILHTVFATHFGRPLPRWADEGACTTTEHPTEKAKYHQHLLQALTTQRGIPFNRMYAMMEYGDDMMALYAQGHSLANFFIALGGKQRFVQYVGDGMQWNNWTAATKKHYGFESLSQVQVTWNQWVGQGCPPLRRPDAPQLEPIGPNRTEELLAGVRGAGGTVPVKAASYETSPTRVAVSSPAGDGWYARTWAAARAARQQQSAVPSPGNVAAVGPRPRTDIATLPPDRMMTRPLQPQPARQINLEGGYAPPPANVQPGPGHVVPAPSSRGAVPVTSATVPLRGQPAAQVIRTVPGNYQPITTPLSVASTPLYLSGSCFGGT